MRGSWGAGLYACSIQCMFYIGAIEVSGSRFGSGSTTLSWPYPVECDGSEAKLIYCVTDQRTNINCDNDIGVICPQLTSKSLFY